MGQTPKLVFALHWTCISRHFMIKSGIMIKSKIHSYYLEGSFTTKRTLGHKFHQTPGSEGSTYLGAGSANGGCYTLISLEDRILDHISTHTALATRTLVLHSFFLERTQKTKPFHPITLCVHFCVIRSPHEPYFVSLTCKRSCAGNFCLIFGKKAFV